MANTYSAGIVTAYGAAVRGGYTGTYEEFCAQQAAFAENAEQVSEDRAAVEQIKTTFENQTVPAAVQQVNQAGAAQVQAVQAAGADEESDIAAAGVAQEARVLQAGAAQEAAVNAAGSTQVQAVQTAGSTQVTAVQGAGTTQVAAVNAAGASQVDAVEDKGEEVLASIPQDYSALSGEVDDLESAVDEVSGNRNLFNKAAFSPDKEINSAGNIVDSSQGAGISDFILVAGHSTVKFSISGSSLTAGRMYFIAEYDAGKQFIQRIAASTAGYTYTVASGVSYIRCVIRNNIIDFFQIEYDTITPYKKYVQVSDIAALQVTANNTKFNEIEDRIGKNLFDLSQFVYGKEYNSAGSIVDSNTVGYSNFIPVIDGVPLVFSKNGAQVANYILYYVIEFDAQKSFLRRVTATTVSSYTPSEDASFVRLEVKNTECYTFQAEYGAISNWKPGISNQILADNCLMASVNMFGSIAGIGDSYTCGMVVSSGGSNVTRKEQSYIATMGKRSGVDWFNYGVSGATTRSYLTISGGLPDVLAADPHDLYIFALGQNDINTNLTLGTIADIHDSDYSQNPDTFFGNYGKIIAQIKAHAPKAKMVMVKSWIDGISGASGLDYQSFDDAIQAIAAHYSIPCISPFDDALFNSPAFKRMKNGGHPTTMGYSMMGLAMERLFSKCVLSNLSYFKYAIVG